MHLVPSLRFRHGGRGLSVKDKTEGIILGALELMHNAGMSLSRAITILQELENDDEDNEVGLD